MIKSAFFFTLSFCFLAPALTLAGPRADVLKLEQGFNAAYAANDLDKYFGYYSDDAVFWFPEGRTDLASYKKEWSEFLSSGGAIKAGTTSDMHVKFSPKQDTAVASYVLRLTQQEADKKVHTENFQETDVWFKTDTGWKIAHVHYSAAPVPRKK